MLTFFRHGRQPIKGTEAMRVEVSVPQQVGGNVLHISVACCLPNVIMIRDNKFCVWMEVGGVEKTSQYVSHLEESRRTNQWC